MHSEEYPIEVDGEAQSKAHIAPWLRTRRAAFGVLVLLPTLVVLIYTALFASPRYEARAEFMIRGIEREAPPVGGLAELVSGGPAMGSAQREALAVRDYLLSLEGIDDLALRGVDVESLLHGEDADWITTLWHRDRRAEGLRDYYQAMVDIDYNANDGIARLSARAYSPQAAQELAQALIELGEQQVNTFNTRAIAAGEELARAELDQAELELASIQAELTNYRDLTGELDPATTGRSAAQEVESLEAELALERANLSSMRVHLAASSPLVVAAQSRVSTLQNAVAQMRAQLTGDADALNQRLANYERLTLRQEFAAKRYETAQAQLEEAQSQTARQRLFLVSVVNPNLPEKPVAPRPIRSTLLALLGLALAFAIGWLLLAGIREHQAD